MSKHPLFAIIGLIIPVFFILFSSILGASEPGYKAIEKTISVMGGFEGVKGLIFNIGLSLVGILIILFAQGFNRHLQKGSKIGGILLVIGGVGLIGCGIFPCDADCINVNLERNFVGHMHVIFATITGVSLGIALILLYFVLKKEGWEKYTGFTMLLAIVANLVGIAFWISFFTSRLSSIGGLLERTGIIFPMIWISVVSLHILTEGEI